MNPELVGRILHVTSEPDPWGRWSFNSNPSGIAVAHTWLQIAALLWGIEEFGIETFIELGTYLGGLGSILLPGAAYGKFAYLSIERDAGVVDVRFRQEVEKLADHRRAALWSGDVFDPEMVESVRLKVQQAEGPTLIYCDDGNKPQELRTYAALLRVGDYIGAHDYPGEVKVEDFQPLLSQYGLEEVTVDFWREGIGVIMLKKVRASE